MINLCASEFPSVLLMRISGPNGPWLTALGLLVVIILMVVGLWMHRREWQRMRRDRTVRRRKRDSRRMGRRQGAWRR